MIPSKQTEGKIPTIPSPNGSCPSLVEVRALNKQFGDHIAVKDVSFKLDAGEVLGLLGPNGAGKSTTMMMIAGLLAPTGGSVRLHGRDANARDYEQRRLLGVVPQEYAIYQELSALDNLRFFGQLYGLRGEALKSRCGEVLEQIGLTGSALRLATTYSGGMKRRLNFGIGIMHRPKVLILDEPTVGVDPQSRSHLMDCIRGQVAEGVGVIYASHYMEEVQAICRRVAIIDHGEILANDSIAKLLAGVAVDLYLYVDRTEGIGDQLGDLGHVGTGSNGEPAVIISGNAAEEPTDLNSLPLRYGTRLSPDDGIRTTPDLAWRLQAALVKLGTLGIRVLRVETQQSNLERLFLKLTGKRLRD